MSMSADIHDTILSFCVANKIPQDKAIALLRDIVDDMNGDGDSYDFSFVANVYASEQARRPTPLALDAATASAQQEEIKTNLRNCKCVVVETPRQ